ncbi:protein of unknown function [Xenorhabdus doucetiae]|uniref:Uncharacterized protein n=1 Tax=Xenorhabdus doucetiae TaxID=351671 RepID=A0A068QQW0_9GAMM|nr:protein of unknown function [Xenorhabdus doucetiae]
MTKIKHLSYIYIVIYYLPSFYDEKLILTKNKSYVKVPYKHRMLTFNVNNTLNITSKNFLTT